MSIFWSDDLVTVHHGDALALPVADSTVDLVVTSPPYFGLRSYTDGGEHYAGQIGSESTPAEFVDQLISATAEMVRVLKPTGSLWVNLGDKYAERTGPARSGGIADDPVVSRPATRPPRGRRGAVPVKSLMGIPWRYAIRCIDELGLILRAEVIWAKPNGLPESVTDRVRRSHEQWFHFTTQPRYFAGVDEVREPHTMRPQRRPNGRPEDLTPRLGQPRQSWSTAQRSEPGVDGNPLGRVPGSVWDIPTQPLTVPVELGIDHFAAFPMEWPRRIIRGWSPSGICTACGEGRRPIVRRTVEDDRPGRVQGREVDALLGGHGADGRAGSRRRSVVSLDGEECACADASAPATPAVVLDPFGGTGTTALVARALGRRAVHVDLSRDYCRLAQWRLTDPAEAARALGVDKPDPVPAGQSSIFDVLEEATA